MHNIYGKQLRAIDKTRLRSVYLSVRLSHSLSLPKVSFLSRPVPRGPQESDSPRIDRAGSAPSAEGVCEQVCAPPDVRMRVDYKHITEAYHILFVSSRSKSAEGRLFLFVCVRACVQTEKAVLASRASQATRRQGRTMRRKTPNDFSVRTRVFFLG